MRLDTRDVTGRVEPATRCKIPSQEEKGFVSQFRDFKHFLLRQAMFR
jgi:hypothetical protein